MKITPGIYRHYKGNLYQVHFTARHSETLEDMVIYETLYDNPRGRYWARPAKMFGEIVEFEGKKIKRFTKIKTE